MATVTTDVGRVDVSIHAPREGCDFCDLKALQIPNSFNSRTPGGVRQLIGIVTHCLERVSIHAPREGCDTDP